MQQRFATRDHDHWSTTFIDGREAFIDAQALIEDRVRVIDLTATGAGEVATEKRLEHQNERIPPDTPQMLPDNIGSYSDRLVQRNRHRVPPPRNYDSELISTAGVRELRRHSKADILGDAREFRKFDRGHLAQPGDQIFDQHRRG
jgi:hypothetical protein